MTDYLDKLKAVAEKRTSGRWEANWHADPRESGMIVSGVGPIIPADDWTTASEQAENDGIFIALAANCFDELVAVAEAAMDCALSSHHMNHGWPCRFEYRHCDCGKDQLDKALAALRQKVEGEGG